MLNVRINPSEGNFVYLELDFIFAENLQKYLFEKGFIIKLININRTTSAIRLAVRSGLDNHLLCANIEKFINENN